MCSVGVPPGPGLETTGISHSKEITSSFSSFQLNSYIIHIYVLPLSAKLNYN